MKEIHEVPFELKRVSPVGNPGVNGPCPWRKEESKNGRMTLYLNEEEAQAARAANYQPQCYGEEAYTINSGQKWYIEGMIEILKAKGFSEIKARIKRPLY